MGRMMITRGSPAPTSDSHTGTGFLLSVYLSKQWGELEARAGAELLLSMPFIREGRLFVKHPFLCPLFS